MNILSIVYLLAFLIYLWLIGFLLYKNPKLSLNRVCALVILCFAILSVTNLLELLSSDNNLVVYENIGALGWCSFPSFVLWFFLIFTKRWKILRHKIVYISFFLIPCIFIYRQWTGYLVVDVLRTDYGRNIVWSKSIWPAVYYIYYLLFVLIGLYLCFDFSRRTKKIFEKKQANIIFAVSIISLLLGTTTDVVLPELGIFNVPPVASVIILIWALGLVQAITKYGLMTVTPRAAAEDILATMTESLILINPDRRITKVNRATLDLLQYDEQELIGRYINTILKDDSLFKSSQFQRLIRKGQIKDYELVYYSKSGQEIPVIFSGAVLMDKRNIFRGIVGVAKDIRERKKRTTELQALYSELKDKSDKLSNGATAMIHMLDSLEKTKKKLSSANEYIENILKNMLDALVVLDPQLKIETVNRAALNLFGYSRQELLGKQFDILLSKDDSRSLKVDEFQRRLRQEGVILNFEMDCKTKQKELIPALFSGSAIKDEQGKLIRCIILARDITHLKQIQKEREHLIQELRRSNQELQDFTYVVSHDLQAPLRKIVTFGEFLNEDCAKTISSEGKTYIARMREAAFKMQRLIKDLLELSRVGTRGKRPEPVNTSELLCEVMDILEIDIKQSNAKIKVAEPLPNIMVDRTQFIQVFQNLINNAIKYAQKNKLPLIEIKAKKKKDEVEFCVKDNGIGIAEQYLDRIFRIFEKLHTADKYAGTGVGLTLVKKIIERHGGRIWCESKPGKGSTFCFTVKSA